MSPDKQAIHRAYALVAACHYQPQSAEQRAEHAIEITIRNIGQTPAFEFSVEWEISPDSYLRQMSSLRDLWSAPVRRGRTAPTALIPGDCEMFDADLLGFGSLPPEIIANPDIAALYHVSGIANYQDAFGKPHFTNFNIYLRCEQHGVLRCRRHFDGNEAN